MIEEGDLVRIKNKHLKPPFGLFGKSKPGTYTKTRGEQRIARVVRVVSDVYDWRHRVRNRVVELDITNPYTGTRYVLNSSWLVVHRKAKKSHPILSNGITDWLWVGLTTTTSGLGQPGVQG
jgi:hypothetical protein